MQLYEQRYANRLLSDPDQFIYNTSFLMKQCRSDITILMHLSICRHLNLKNVRFFFKVAPHHFSEIIISHSVVYCFDYAIKNDASRIVTSPSE